jgi:Rps23 Pro-64 3,4-dihydroxylase Tpa1-like proline 4-hydroxylase
MIRWPALPALARKFAKGEPFRHVLVDGVLDASEFAALTLGFLQEPMTRVEGEIHSHLRSAEPPANPSLRNFLQALSPAVVGQICGRSLSRVDGAAYTYAEGDYLLPHSDHRTEEGRAVAWAYYIAPPIRGGELDLYERTGRRVAKRIAPRANRLVLFEVHERALHEVREVIAGQRDSIAGWFYP